LKDESEAMEKIQFQIAMCEGKNEEIIANWMENLIIERK
jgi:hypothetical protein